MKWKTLSGLLLLSGCGTTAGVADATSDADVVSAGDVVLNDVVAADVSPEAQPASDAATDATLAIDVAPMSDASTETSVDASQGTSVMIMEESATLLRVRADEFCGSSIGMVEPYIAAYGVRSGTRSELRLSMQSHRTGEPLWRQVVLDRSEGPEICVGRYAFDARSNTLGWWSGNNTINVARIDPAGRVIARGSARLPSAVPARLVENNLSVYSGRVSFVVSSAEGTRLHLATIGNQAGTVEMPATITMTISAGADLPRDVSSVESSWERLIYTRSSVSGQAFMHSISVSSSNEAVLAPAVILTGLGEQPHVESLAYVNGSSELRAVFTSGTRNIDLYLLSQTSGGLATRLFAAATAWNRSGALAVNLLQTATGGDGVVWASHNGAGYNATVYFGRRDEPAASACVVLRAAEETSRWRLFTFDQAGARDKLLLMIRRVGNGGGTDWEELRWQNRSDGEGICNL